MRSLNKYYFLSSGKAAASQIIAKTIKVEAHTVLIFPAGTLVSSGCAAVFEGWTRSASESNSVSERTALRSYFSGGGKQRTWLDVAAITHTADRLLIPHMLCVTVRRPCCFCLSTQRNLIDQYWEPSFFFIFYYLLTLEWLTDVSRCGFFLTLRCIELIMFVLHYVSEWLHVWVTYIFNLTSLYKWGLLGRWFQGSADDKGADSAQQWKFTGLNAFHF